jgi:hypothetical protein
VPGITFANTINPKYLTSQTNGLPNPAYLAPNTTPGTFGFHPWLFGPHQFHQDLALTKTIPIHESLRFVFQTEFLNVWNHPVWANPAGGSNTTVGYIQQTQASNQSTSFGHSYVVQAAPGVSGVGARQIEFRTNIEFRRQPRRTVPQAGLAGMQNGELPALAERSRWQAVISYRLYSFSPVSGSLVIEFVVATKSPTA